MQAVQVLQAEFLKSAADRGGWPAGGLQEIAFCGRSNVGKSTLLNALLQRRGMARVSRTPGRTRLLNFFALRLAAPGAPAEDLMVADLPGFGYAQVSKSERATWRPLIQGYLSQRASLRAVVLLADSRRVMDLKQEPHLLDEEVELCRWLQELGKAVVPVMTKADKLSKHERKPAAERLHRLLGLAPIVFSSLTGEGSDALWQRLWRALHPPEGPIDQVGASDRVTR